MDLTFVAFDTETTGKYPLESEICEIAAVKWRAGEIVDTFQTLLKPSQPMSAEVIKIHNITNEMVASAPIIGDKINEFYNFIRGCIPVAHHAPFDLGFVSIEFEKAGLELPGEQVICSSLLSRNIIKESSNHRLQTLVKLLNINGGQAHRALDDAKACMHVAWECFKRLGEHITLQELIKHQGAWLSWKHYSILSLEENKRFQNIVSAIRRGQEINLTYDGGSRPGRSRVVKPIGLVRSPNGDFLVALENGINPPKRYFLNKISDALIV